MMNRWRIGRLVTTGALALAVAGCSDFLNVEDPARFTDDDLDQALPAVANGVEGDLHLVMDVVAYASALIADEFQNTGTWTAWDDIDHGRIRYNQSGTGNGVQNVLLRTRFAAQDAAERITRVMGADAASSPEMAQVQTTEAWIDLLQAQHYCEAPDVDAGVAIPDTDMWSQALTKLNTAIATAQAAGAAEYEQWATAGRARVHLMLGNYAEALADARSIPDGWSYDANFSENSAAQNNAVVNLSTTGFNNAGGIREKWWNQVDIAAGLLMDPLTGELDARVPIRHDDPNELGVDGVTPYYSQWKYTSLSADIPFTHSEEMRLIEAEVLWRQDDLTGAMTILNGLRTAVGLSTVSATTSAEVFDVLLNERFAELFMEGHRANDLYRFDLTATLQAAGDFVGSEANRAVKFPLTTTEAINNTNIEDNAAVRCSPTT